MKIVQNQEDEMESFSKEIDLLGKNLITKLDKSDG